MLQSFSNAAPGSPIPATAVSLSPLGSSLPTLDFETRSKADIKKVGAYRYSMDPSTSVLCVVYDLKDGKGRRLWHPWAGGIPSDLIAHAQNGLLLEGHNVEFEYCIWNFVCTRLYGWPKLNFKQLRCSASKAAALALPRPLEDLGAALEVPVKKDMDGRRLMLKMSRPRKPTKNDPSEWVEGINELERLFQYCETDVVAEEHCSLAMPDLSERELAVFRLTQKINERGIYCDRALCETAVRFSKQFEHDLTAELRSITGGAVTTAKQVAKLSAFLSEEGVEVENLQAKTVGDLLKAGVDSATAKRVLEIRQLLGKSSISKFQAMLNMAGPDDRIRGTLLYHGASTGRWAGRGIQPQNYPQGKIKDVHNIYAALADGDYEWFRTLFPDVFTALSASLRGMLRAPTGRELIAADFSAIEARVVCWLAGDFANLEVYINGEDPYKLMASAIFNVPVSQVTKAQRELGKRAVLGCGFGMGWEKFMATCEAQGQPVTADLAQRAVNAYRYKYAAVKAFWNDIEEAAIRAVKYPGKRFDVNELIQWLVKGSYLYGRLPSGRLLAYYAPKIERRASPYGERDQLTYMAVDSKTKQWVREGTYGGKLTENVVQATARDVMTDSMFRVERAGYETILTVHDEVVCEVPEGFGSLDQFEGLMSELPPWAKGLPIKVEGWRDVRFRK